ncbi:hypothetical protein M3Y97_00144800 [Aphelenchoides bicaudatus]|nr:hypothetical protein M3Y97_00144800 [Aphelenchoides bicaudatus]
MKLYLLVGVLFVAFYQANAVSEQIRLLNTKCRDLLTCSIQKGCVQVDMLRQKFTNQTITKQMYDDLDKHIDYGCIFTSKCQEECNRCPLCETGKLQLIDILSGSRRESGGECSVLVNCAADCIERSGSDLAKINLCLRHQCAFHCFDGSCLKCSAFITRIFNQVCVAADFRSLVSNFNGHCFEMFRDIVAAKFVDQFKATGGRPSIGIKQQQDRQ